MTMVCEGGPLDGRTITHDDDFFIAGFKLADDKTTSFYYMELGGVWLCTLQQTPMRTDYIDDPSLHAQIKIRS